MLKKSGILSDIQVNMILRIILWYGVIIHIGFIYSFNILVAYKKKWHVKVTILSLPLKSFVM